jgi:hypothetical protein
MRPAAAGPDPGQGKARIAAALVVLLVLLVGLGKAGRDLSQPTPTDPPSPYDRGRFEGLDPDAARGYQAAQRELWEQHGIRIFTAGPRTAKRSVEEQRELRREKGRQAWPPTADAPHVAGIAFDITARGPGVTGPGDPRIVAVMGKYGLVRPHYTLRVLGEPWHYQLARRSGLGG